MKPQKDYRPMGCRECLHGADLGFDFSMAFQPIIDVDAREVFAYEALVRGTAGEPASEVFRHVGEGNRYRFDQACRVKAIELASRLGMAARLSINFMPNAVYRPELCIRTTLDAAETYGFPIDRIVFEITESERIDDRDHLRNIVSHYQQRGFLTAIDDFGAGYSGLNLLADVRTDLVKLDLALVRGVESDAGRRAIIRGVVSMCADLGMRVVAEGVETPGEYEVLHGMGIRLFQGFLFCRPAFRSLPEVRWPD